ncbi:MAG: LytR family transcriptional regulator [Propionibacteriales bacterium]|nr:LytR family transcriptional regulator [Propionibacteriales bacterium]
MVARIRRVVTFGALLVLLAAVVPSAGRTDAELVLLKMRHAEAIDHPDGIVWMLALGSDARPGDSIPRSRADSIHLVGVNTRTGHSAIIGLPRDSYVSIPGQGSNKINASMVYGGPQLTARTVERLTGIRLDYVFLTDFSGLAGMIYKLGGIDLRITQPVSGLGHRFERGMRHLNGSEALGFSRIRYGLPGGDFDRSRNQGRVLVAALKKARSIADQPGRLEGMMLAAITRLDTNASPAEVYRLGRSLLSVEPSKVRNCVVPGGTGYAGEASVVFLNRSALHRMVRDARPDGRLNRGC